MDNLLFAYKFPDGEIVFYYDGFAMRRAYSWTSRGNPAIPVGKEFVKIGDKQETYELRWINKQGE